MKKRSEVNKAVLAPTKSFNELRKEAIKAQLSKKTKAARAWN